MKMSKSIYKLIIPFLIIHISVISFAGVNELSDYYKTIRCLVCEGQSIQESDTEFAINLKAVSYTHLTLPTIAKV